MDNLRIADATVKSYIAIEKRNGLSEIGRRLLHGTFHFVPREERDLLVLRYST